MGLMMMTGCLELSTDTLQALAKECNDLKNSNNLTDDKDLLHRWKEEGMYIPGSTAVLLW